MARTLGFLTLVPASLRPSNGHAIKWAESDRHRTRVYTFALRTIQFSRTEARTPLTPSRGLSLR